MVILGTLTVMFILLLPLHVIQVPYAYLGGMLLVLGMVLGAAKSIVDGTYLFSWSVYNVAVVFAYFAALAYFYFSFKVLRAMPASRRRSTLLGTGGIVLVTTLAAVVISSNTDSIMQARIDAVQDRIDGQVAALETIDERVEFLVDSGNIPSLAAGIVVDDTLVWMGAFGSAGLDTIYNVGSVTKPLVATAVLQLQEQGLLNLNDDVNAYLPFELRHPEYPDVPITIRMLLTHQSGLGHITDTYEAYHLGTETLDWLAAHADFSYPDIEPRPSLEAFLAEYVAPSGGYYTPDNWYVMQPGMSFGYSTPGYDILAYIVELVSGQPFTAYLQANVLDPLGMADSGFASTDFPGQHAAPHERFAGILSISNAVLPVSDYRTVGGGGLYSCVRDLAQFMMAHLNAGAANDAQILQPQSVALMHEMAVLTEGGGDLNQAGYGLGVAQMNVQPWQFWGHFYDMQGAIGHGGSTWGTVGQMWFVKQDSGGYGIVLLTNVDRDFEPDDYLRFFAIDYRIQVELLAEAAVRYAQAH